MTQKTVLEVLTEVQDACRRDMQQLKVVAQQFADNQAPSDIANGEYARLRQALAQYERSLQRYNTFMSRPAWSEPDEQTARNDSASLRDLAAKVEERADGQRFAKGGLIGG